MPKADKLLAMLWLLQSREKITAQQMADELEMHIRSIYRGIDALCMSGVPVVAEIGRDGGYSLPRAFQAQPLFFALDEQTALLHAATFARETGYPAGEALERAIAKIKTYTNAAQRQRLEQHERSLDAIHPPVASELSAKLTMLSEALEGRQALDIAYQSGYEGTTSRRTIDPYGLVYWKDRWYAVCYCHLRGEIRSFRVDRMHSLTITDTRFEQPESFSAREFLLGGLLPVWQSATGGTDGATATGNRLGGWDDGQDGQDQHHDHSGLSEQDNGDPENIAHNTHHLVSVHVQGNPQALDDLCSHWLFGHFLARRTQQDAYFQLDEPTLYLQLPYHLLTYGGKVSVVSPAELRSCMADILSELLEHYRT